MPRLDSCLFYNITDNTRFGLPIVQAFLRPEYTKKHEILFLSSRGPNQKQKQDLCIERNMTYRILFPQGEAPHPSDTGGQKKETTKNWKWVSRVKQAMQVRGD